MADTDQILHNLIARVDALERENHRLRGERAVVPAAPPPAGAIAPAAALEQLSRRWILRRVVQASAAAAVAGVLIQQHPQTANAEYFESLQTPHLVAGYGEDRTPIATLNQSASHPTIDATNEGTGIAVKGTSAGGPAIFGEATGASSVGVSGSGTTNGVYGFTASGVGVLGDGLIGVQGVTATNGNAAVYGQHTGQGPGVVGDGAGAAASHAGVLGRNGTGTGVRGQGLNGVVGVSTASSYGAVYGQHTNNGYGVVGDGAGANYAGVLGRNPSGVGVRGEGSRGVHGTSTQTGNGAIHGQHLGSYGYGLVGDGVGVDGSGVLGRNSAGEGVRGEGQTGVSGIGKHGVHGTSAVTGGNALVGDGIGAATGVKGTSVSGFGAVLGGGRAQLRLLPRPTAGKPTSGVHAIGEVYLDKLGAIFVCTVAGTPGTWRKVSTTVG